MQVWAIASARATIGGPLRRDLLSLTSASAALFQSHTTLGQRSSSMAESADAEENAATTKSAATKITRAGKKLPPFKENQDAPGMIPVLAHRVINSLL